MRARPRASEGTATVPYVPTLAIDIGGTKTAAAVINDDDAFLEHTTWSSPSTATEAIDRIVATCAPWSNRDDNHTPQVAGVSFGGPFDFPTQICIRSMHTHGWDDLPLSQQLQQALGIPVITDNDANVAALGEYQQAAHSPEEPKDPLLYVTLSTGVGAAIVANGQLLRGAHSLAGELGHLPIGHDKTCNCGQIGCLERAVSGYWIERDLHQPAQDYLESADNYREWIKNLTRGLWSATVLIDPAVIVIGGGMTSQGDRLLEPLRAALTSTAHASNRTPPALRLGDPSGRTVLAGAAVMAQQPHAAKEEPRGSRG